MNEDREFQVGYMQNTYTVQRKYRQVNEGKPFGRWIYHDLFASNDSRDAWEFFNDRPEDKPWDLTILVTVRS